MTNAFDDCPRCGGYSDFDEEGKQYTCFFCCNTGRVPMAVSMAYYQERVDEAEAFAPKRLGIFIRMPVSEYDDFCEEEMEAERVPGHRLFTRFPEIQQIARVRDRARMAAVAASYFQCENDPDDIPF